MKLIALALLFSMSSLASGETSTVTCVGTAYIPELKRSEELKLNINWAERTFEMYDFNSDIWEWIPFAIAKQIPKDSGIQYYLGYDGDNFPANLPPEDYVLIFEIEDHRATPKFLRNFRGVLTGYKIPPTTLSCQP